MELSDHDENEFDIPFNQNHFPRNELSKLENLEL